MKTLLIVIAAVLFITLAVVFFPKSAGGSCGMCPSPPAIHLREKGCIGIRTYFHPNDIPGFGCFDCGRQVYCFGIVTNEETCYTSNQVEIPDCKEPETIPEKISICDKLSTDREGCLYNVARLAGEENYENISEICDMLERKQMREACEKQFT